MSENALVHKAAGPFYFGQASSTESSREAHSSYSTMTSRLHSTWSAPVLPVGAGSAGQRRSKLAASVGGCDVVREDAQPTVIKTHVAVHRLFQNTLNLLHDDALSRTTLFSLSLKPGRCL